MLYYPQPNGDVVLAKVSLRLREMFDLLGEMTMPRQ